jgi:type IV pilus assembly protein PilM
MAKVIWGMDFGDWALKVARGIYDKKSDTITVDLFDEIVYGELPCGYEASLLDKHREGVIAFKNKYHVAPGDAVCVAVSGSEVFSRFINLPPVPERVGEIIRYEARQQIPFDIDDVVWDYQPVKEQHEVGEEIEVGLFALKKERVAELMDLLAPWRGNLRVVQDAPLAVYNLLEYEGQVKEAAIVLDVGAATTDVLVLNPPRFWVRTLLVAGDDLTGALVEQFGVGNAEAEKIKRQLGRSAHKEQILRVLQPVFDDLINEIQRSLGYYKSLAREVKFERVVALGSALKMTGLTQMLAAGLQYQVQVIRDLSRMRVAGSVDREKFEAALPGLGAALGLLVQGAGQGRVRINMVPEELALASTMATKKPWLVGAAVGVVVAVGVLIGGARLYAQSAAGELAGEDFTPMDKAANLQQEYTAAANEAQNAERQLQSMTEAGVSSGLDLELLTIYTEKMPIDVYSTQIRFEWMEPSEIGAIMRPLMVGAPSGGGGAPTAPGPGAAGFTPAGRPAGGGPPPDIRAMMEMEIAARHAAVQAEEAAARRAAMEEDRAAAVPGGPAARGPSVPAGVGGVGLEAQRGADRTEKSRLVMRFVCESSKLEHGRTYIQTAVFDALKAAQLAENRSAFSEVRMLGDVRDIYRDASTGQEVPGMKEGVNQYVGFEGYAVVNVGLPPEAPKATPAK